MPTEQSEFSTDQGGWIGATSTGYITPPGFPTADLPQPEGYHSPPNIPVIGNYQEPVVARKEKCKTNMITGFLALLPLLNCYSVPNIPGSNSRRKTEEGHCTRRTELHSVIRVSQRLYSTHVMVSLHFLAH